MTPDPNPTALPDPDLYFTDGNVVLAAPDAIKPSVWYFRVHKSILARNSPAFDSMFSPPPLPTQSEGDTYDGVLKVDLPDDAVIVKTFLKSLYGPRSSLLNPRSWHDRSTRSKQTAEIIGLVRFANKYQADTFRSHVCDPLFYDWPHDIAGWDKRADFLTKRFMYPSAIIRIARDSPPDSYLRHLLPLAFYILSCSLFDKADDWDSNGRGPPPQNQSFLLSREDIATLAFGRAAIGKWVAERTQSEFSRWPPRRSCTGSSCGCPVKVQKRWANLQNDVLETMDVLYVLRSQGNTAPELCGVCGDPYRAGVEQMRRDFFTELPDMFGFERRPVEDLRPSLRVD